MEDVRLMLGDCLERMSEIADQSVDLVLCDLPYGTTQNAWDSVLPLAPLWAHYWRVCRGAVVLTAAQPFTSILGTSCIRNLRYSWVWDKVGTTGFQNVRHRPLRRHEDILVFAQNTYTYNAQKEIRGKPRTKGGKRKDNGCYNPISTQSSFNNEYHPTSILVYSNAVKLGLEHPTQKPVALMEYMIRTYTNPGAVVLDNCMGSGTTGVAALNCGRRFIGIEKDPTYFDVAERRIRSCDAYQMLYS